MPWVTILILSIGFLSAGTTTEIAASLKIQGEKVALPDLPCQKNSFEEISGFKRVSDEKGERVLLTWSSHNLNAFFCQNLDMPVLVVNQNVVNPKLPWGMSMQGPNTVFGPMQVEYVLPAKTNTPILRLGNGPDMFAYKLDFDQQKVIPIKFEMSNAINFKQILSGIDSDRRKSFDKAQAQTSKNLLKELAQYTDALAFCPYFPPCTWTLFSKYRVH